MCFLMSSKLNEGGKNVLAWCTARITTLVAMHEVILPDLSWLRTWTRGIVKQWVWSSPWLKKRWRVGSCFQTNSIIPNGFCGSNHRACIIEFALLKCPSCYPSSNPQAFVGERARMQSHLCLLLQKKGVFSAFLVLKDEHFDTSLMMYIRSAMNRIKRSLQPTY